MRRPLSSGQLIAYGLPGLPAAMLGLPLLIYVPTFYAETVGLGLAAVGQILLAARLADVVVDPLVGWASDRTHTRWGRRRPWLAAALPLVLVATWSLFMPPEDATAWHLAVWAVAAYFGWTMMTIPYQAWGAELSEEYAERSRVVASREGFAIAGTIVAVTMPALAPAILVDQGGPAEAAALTVIAWATAVMLPLAGIVLLAVLREPAPRASDHFDWRRGIRLVAANAPFRRLIAAWLLGGIANGLPSTLFFLYASYVLDLRDSAGAFLIAYFAAGIAGIPLWLWLARRVGKHRAWCVAMAWACVFFLAVPLLGAGDFWPFLAICLATGLSLGADLVLPPSMQADVVDVDTAAGGGQRTGLYFALWAMATKLAYALAVGIAFPVLAMIGFAPEPGNAPAALAGLAALYSLAPVAFKAAAVVLIWRFPIDAAAQAGLRRDIAVRASQEIPTP